MHPAALDSRQTGIDSATFKHDRCGRDRRTDFWELIHRGRVEAHWPCWVIPSALTSTPLAST